MTVEIVMPKMGESIQEGKVLQWLKKEGEKIERDQPILEISTDKVDTEVPAPVDGILVKILAQPDDTVEVGVVVGIIETDVSAAASGGSSAPAPAKAPEPAPASAPVAAPAPAPAPVVVAAPAPAPVVSAPIPAPAASNGVQTYDIPRESGSRFYSPLVRSIAEAEKVSVQELDTITGTGIDGRVTKVDLLGYIQNRTSGTNGVAAPAPTVVYATPAATPTPSAPSAPSAPELPKNWGDDVEIVPMDRVRQLIAEHMVKSKLTSPHVTSVQEADVTNIVKFREKNKAAFEKREGMKLTYTPFFAKAAIDGVKAFPDVNVSVDGKNIVKHKKLNLSFATALDDGNLIVPVIKNADALNITGLARAVTDLAGRARSKKLSPDDIQGGTFTITNVGTFGSLFGNPVINQPQVAIMGIGAIQKRPVVIEVEGNDLIVVRHMVYMSLTYDHRVVDGALAGQCLNAICKSLEKMNENTIMM